MRRVRLAVRTVLRCLDRIRSASVSGVAQHQSCFCISFFWWQVKRSHLHTDMSSKKKGESTQLCPKAPRADFHVSSHDNSVSSPAHQQWSPLAFQRFQCWTSFSSNCSLWPSLRNIGGIAVRARWVQWYDFTGNLHRKRERDVRCINSDRRHLNIAFLYNKHNHQNSEQNSRTYAGASGIGEPWLRGRSALGCATGPCCQPGCPRDLPVNQAADRGLSPACSP